MWVPNLALPQLGRGQGGALRFKQGRQQVRHAIPLHAIVPRRAIVPRHAIPPCPKWHSEISNMHEAVKNQSKID